MRVAAMVMLVFVSRNRDEVQMGMPHPALRGECVGMTLHGSRWPAQNGDFQAIFMAKMHVRSGNAEVVVLMLCINQALGQVAQSVIIHVSERCHAGCRSVGQMRMLGRLAQHLADCLGAAGVAACHNERVHLRQKIVVNGDGDTFHKLILRRFPPPHNGTSKDV
jgi:hypothetical protein